MPDTAQPHDSLQSPAAALAAFEQPGMSKEEHRRAFAAGCAGWRAGSRVSAPSTPASPTWFPWCSPTAMAPSGFPFDGKPKRHAAIETAREHSRRTPACSLLIDHYEEDWRALWWVRVDGHASVVRREEAGFAGALAAASRQVPAIRLGADHLPPSGSRSTASRSGARTPESPRYARDPNR